MVNGKYFNRLSNFGTILYNYKHSLKVIILKLTMCRAKLLTRIKLMDSDNINM